MIECGLFIFTAAFDDKLPIRSVYLFPGIIGFLLLAAALVAVIYFIAIRRLRAKRRQQPYAFKQPDFRDFKPTNSKQNVEESGYGESVDAKALVKVYSRAEPGTPLIEKVSDANRALSLYSWHDKEQFDDAQGSDDGTDSSEVTASDSSER